MVYVDLPILERNIQGVSALQHTLSLELHSKGISKSLPDKLSEETLPERLRELFDRKDLPRT